MLECCRPVILGRGDFCPLGRLVLSGAIFGWLLLVSSESLDTKGGKKKHSRYKKQIKNYLAPNVNFTEVEGCWRPICDSPVVVFFFFFWSRVFMIFHSFPNSL